MTDDTLTLENFASILREAPNLGAAFLSTSEILLESRLWTVAYRDTDPPSSTGAPGQAGTRRVMWRESQYRDIIPHVAAVVRYLSDLGVQPGDRVTIISQTRPEWGITDLAIQCLGAVAVSIYPSSTWNEAGYILHDATSRVVFIENEEQWVKIQSLRANPCAIPASEGPASEATPATSVRVEIPHVISYEQVTPTSSATPLLFTDIINQAPPFGEARTLLEQTVAKNRRNRQDLASLVYTSGTTGVAKGVMQTHGNHLSNVVQAMDSQTFGADGSLFLYLPLAHSFARLIYYIGVLTPASLIFPSVVDHKSSRLDLAAVAHEMRESGLHFLPSVPRLFEKLQSHLEARMSAAGLQGLVLGLALKNGLRRLSYVESQKRVPPHISLLHWILSPLRHAVKAQLFGLRFRHAISGGSRLAPEVCRFFAALDIDIYEGYGLTETCVATHVNRPGHRKFGTVGPALLGVSTKIADDGEILIQGPNVALGYLNRPADTAAQWDTSGWFHTGDLGEIDKEGFLRITGRKKDLIVTGGGKKIAPVKVEGILQRSPLVSHVVIFGEGRPYCVAVVTIDAAHVLRAVRNASSGEPDERGKKSGPAVHSNDAPHSSISLAMVSDAQLHTLVWNSLKPFNEELPSHEQVKKILVLREDFSVENGLLTPTLKVKRNEVLKRWQEAITALW